MNNIKKLFILFLFAFLFIGKVFAGFGEDECNINIEETDITSPGYTIRMPICKEKVTAGYIEVTSSTPTSDTRAQRKSSYSSAYNKGYEIVERFYTVQSNDAKGTYEILNRVPICKESDRKVIAYSTCSDIRKAKDTCTSSCSVSDCGVKDGCTCSQVDDGNGGTKTVASGSYSYRCCKSGWSAYDSNTCKRDNDYEFKKETTSNITIDEVISKCKSETGADSCGSCDAPTLEDEEIEYALECETYKCDVKYEEIKACTPDFEWNDQAVYCVNPDQSFSYDGYKTDTRFNVRECANSYVTTDCGYANILIEGAFHKEDGGISDKAINLALRLWSYHTERDGFDKKGRTGVANLQGNRCDKSVYYMMVDGKKPNVYENTYEYIMNSHKNDYFELAQSKMDSYGYLPDYISNAKTNKAKFTGATFEKIACNGTVGVTCGENETYRVAFELFFNTMLGNKYMMDHLNNLYEEEDIIASTGATLEEDDEGVWIVVSYDTQRQDFERVFGDKEEISCNPRDPRYTPEIEPYCKVKITYYNGRGEVIEDDVEAEKCKKNMGCLYKTTSTAICTPVVTGYQISSVTVKEKPPKSSYSIRKYVACGAPDEYQTMFSYIPKEIPGETREDYEIEPPHYFLNYNCGNDCDKYDPRISNGACTNEESYKSSVYDPSLSCIVNMANTEQKNYYDFSSKLGVNTNFCRVYCSDQVEYYMAGKTAGESGRSFKYDVRDKTSSNMNNYLLSGVVKEKRNCVSEIYYDHLSKEVNWKRIYGLTNEENDRLMENTTWTELFNILHSKASTERNRKENLNQMVYDLYNCNMYKLNNSNMNSLDIYKPGNNRIDYAFKIVSDTYSYSNDNGLDESTSFSDRITYNGGANVSNYNNGNEGEVLGKIGQSGYSVNSGIIRNENNGFGIVKNSDNKAVKYCSGTNCLAYNSDNEDYSYSEFNYTFNTATSHGYRFPTNDYAMFEVITETGFYNKDKYQVFENTGNVSLNTDYSDLLNLESQQYPLSRYAYSECNERICTVNQTVNIKTYPRISNFGKFNDAIRDKVFTCTVNVTPPFNCIPGDPECPETSGGNNSLYRNVDPARMFPNGVKEGSNWGSEVGQRVKTHVENTANILQTTDDLLDYSITLSPEQIKNIKSYNQRHGGYLNERITCTEKIDDSHYYNCVSDFLEALRGRSEEYGDGHDLGDLNTEYTGINRYHQINGE